MNPSAVRYVPDSLVTVIVCIPGTNVDEVYTATTLACRVALAVLTTVCVPPSILIPMLPCPVFFSP